MTKNIHLWYGGPKKKILPKSLNSTLKTACTNSHTHKHTLTHILSLMPLVFILQNNHARAYVITSSEICFVLFIITEVLQIYKREFCACYVQKCTHHEMLSIWFEQQTKTWTIQLLLIDMDHSMVTFNGAIYTSKDFWAERRIVRLHLAVPGLKRAVLS